MTSKLTVTIRYQGEGIIDRVDAELKEALKKIGYTFVGSGFMYETEIRDLQFER